MVDILKTLGLPLGTSFIRNEAAAGGSLQARYETVYAQCMTAKGNRIPVPAGAVGDYESASCPQKLGYLTGNS
jgi:hypothetical protein